ncbi:TraM recognition domain-containing protein [Paraburkholderia strydomiana]|uniref:type IV secretory system conjugative DNA transfer family protein n=1 Tax=Paraburkholderia strydomiana TaxID=1245417 RepID=UPI0038BB90A2
MKSVWRTFFDDPKTKLLSLFIEAEQQLMRSVIQRKYKGTLDPNVYWVTGSAQENVGLSDDATERRVQRLSLSQIGVFLAQRIWSRRLWIVTPAVFILSLILGYLRLHVAEVSTNEEFAPVLSAVIVWIGLMIAFAASFFTTLVAQLLFPRTPVRQDEIDSVKGVMERCVVRAVTADTPPDLRDRVRVAVTDSEGYAIAGQVLSTDLEYSAVRAEWINSRAALYYLGLAFISPAAVAISPWAAIALYFLAMWPEISVMFAAFGGNEEAQAGQRGRLIKLVILPVLLVVLLFGFANSYLSKVPAAELCIQWFYVALMWFTTLRVVLSIPAPLQFRALQLDQSVRETGTELLIDKAGREHFVQLEQARIEQVANATRDTSPFLPIGHSLGLFAQRRDPLSPTEKGLPVGLTVNDLSTHLMVLGASGTRKTTGVLKPVVTRWISENMGGAFVLDGKGALPLLFADLPDFKLISPKFGKFNPIHGMTPDAVADVIADVFSADDDGEPIWRDSARLMLRMAAIVLHAAPDAPYTIPEILRFCVKDQTDRVALLAKLHELPDTRIRAAVSYWALELPGMPDKTRGSIVNMVRTWLGNIVLHEKLGPWCDTTETGWQIEDVLKGAKAGLLLPESEFGVGGIAVSALCMRRIYDAVKLRGDNWRQMDGHTAVLMGADEVQNLLTKADLETVPVARSLGLYLLSATQNVDGLYKRLEKEGALQMIGNYASLIALPPRTEDSNKYVSVRAGKIWKSVTENYYGLPDAASDIGLYMNSGVDRTMREADLHRQRYAATPRLSYAVGLWHREWTMKSAAHGNHVYDLIQPSEAYSFTSKPMLTMAPTDIVQPEEIDTLLARPGTAIAILNRGNVVRRDVIRFGAFEEAAA